MNFPSFFITGTDTGVGKTVATVLLALRLQAAGANVGVMKPFASGCTKNENNLQSDDALFLKEMIGVEDELELINPIRLEEPLTPLTAAQRAGESTAEWMPRVLEAYAELQHRHDCVLVEGVGGLLAPILRDENRYFTCADFAAKLGLPIVVVARRTLGTINHTVLTCRYPLLEPSTFAGLLFCDAEPVSPRDVAAQTSPAIIEAMTGLENWGEVPFMENLTRASLEKSSLQLRCPV